MAVSPGRSPGRRNSILQAAINPATRVDPVRFLIHAACTDTYHDFHSKAGFSDKMKASPTNPGVFDARMGLSVPDGTPYTIIPKNRDHKTGGQPDIDALHDEDELMVETFRHVQDGGQTFATSSNIIQALIAYLKDRDSPEIVDQSFDGLWNPDGTTQTHKYNIKLFRTAAGEADIKNLWLDTKSTPLSKASQNEIGDFFGSDDIFLVFDASVLDLVTFIKSSPDGGRQQSVHRIFNREVVNDPATKTYEDKPLYDHVHSDVYFDNDTGTITYARHAPIAMNSGIGWIRDSAPFHRDKLFSQYDFRLSRLVYQPSGAPRINLELQDEAGSRIHCSADPHEDNNIARCWKRILECYKKDSKHINAAAHVHCKRSGDWLQALSCMDTARIYNNAPIHTVDRSNPENQVSVKGENLVLVTHDRVLLTYALALGIDVIMTYKWTVAGAAGASPTSSAMNADEEDDEGLDDKTSTRFILYFRNSKNDTPEQKRAVLLRQIKSADALYTAESSASRKTYISDYNTWVDIIRGSAQNAINTATAEARAATTLINLGKGVTNLLKAYIRYSSIDYSKLDLDEYTLFERGFIQLRDQLKVSYDGLTPEILLDLSNRAGTYNVRVSNIENRKNRISRLEDLIAANNAYRNNSMYSSPISLTAIVLRSRGSGDSGPLTKILETVSFLVQRLPVEMVRSAVELLKSLRVDKAAYFASDKAYIYDLFLPNFINAAPPAAAIASVRSATAVANNTAAIEEEIKVYQELASAVPAAPAATNNNNEGRPIEEDMEQSPAKLSKLAADEQQIEVMETREMGIEGSAMRKRKTVSIFASIGTAIKRFGQSLIGGGSGATRGGGGPNATDPLKAEFLVKLYLREVYFSLSAFESEGNFDYDYYKTIAIIATIVSKKYSSDWKKQQAFFYEELPKMNFADLYPSGKNTYLRYNLNLAASTLALNAVDLAAGSIPPQGNTGIGTLPLTEIYAYAKTLRGVDFIEERDRLIEECKSAILVDGPAAAVVAAEEVASSTVDIVEAARIDELKRIEMIKAAAATKRPTNLIRVPNRQNNSVVSTPKAKRSREENNLSNNSSPRWQTKKARSRFANKGLPKPLGRIPLGRIPLGRIPQQQAPMYAFGGTRRGRRSEQTYKARSSRRYTRKISVISRL